VQNVFVLHFDLSMAALSSISPSESPRSPIDLSTADSAVRAIPIMGEEDCRRCLLTLPGFNIENFILHRTINPASMQLQFDCTYLSDNENGFFTIHIGFNDKLGCFQTFNCLGGQILLTDQPRWSDFPSLLKSLGGDAHWLHGAQLQAIRSRFHEFDKIFHADEEGPSPDITEYRGFNFRKCSPKEYKVWPKDGIEEGAKEVTVSVDGTFQTADKNFTDLPSLIVDLNRFYHPAAESPFLRRPFPSAILALQDSAEDSPADADLLTRLSTLKM
jgi:hypothetical protein